MEQSGIDGRLLRGHRRQRLLLRQGRPAAAGRPGHRPRHLHPHRLDGRPGDPRPAVPAARADPDAQRRAATCCSRSRTRPSTRAAATRSRGRAGSPASATTRRRSAASSRPSTTCGPTTSRAGSSSSRSSATRPAWSCRARASTSRATGAQAEFENAVDFIEQKIDEGYIRKVKGNSYMEDLTSGNAVAGITWSGDIFVLGLRHRGPQLDVHAPGVRRHAVVGQHDGPDHLDRTARNAQKLMDYYYDPAVAAEVAAWVNYVCPVEGAQAEMEKIDPELAESPWIFPTRRVHRRAQRPAVPGARAQKRTSSTPTMWSTKVMGN